MWSYADKLHIIENSDCDIPEIDILPFLEKPKSTKKTFKIKRKKLNHVINNVMETLELNKEWSNEKQIIYKLSNIMKSEYYDNYDLWTRTIWSLANYKNYCEELSYVFSLYSILL